MEEDGEDRRKKKELDKGSLGSNGAVMSRIDNVWPETVGAQALVEALTGILEAAGLGIVHLDAHGRIVEANSNAERIFEEGDISSGMGGCLFVRNREGNHEVQRVLDCALPPFRTEAIADSVAIVAINRRDGRAPLVMRVTPVSGSEKDIQSRSAAALVVIVDPLRDTGIDPALVQKVLRLTRAEARVAVLLAQGK